MFLTWIKKNKFWVFASLLFLFLRLPSLFEPYWYGDENIYLVLGQAIQRGLTLYSQIHDNKPPTLYYLAAFGQTVFGFRLLLMLWMIPTIYVFHLLSKRLLTLRLSRLSTLFFIILTSIPLFEGSIANAEIFMLLPTILAVYLLFSQRITYYVLLIAGLLLGFAFTIKIPVAFEFAFLCFWILITNFDLKKIGFILKSYFILLISFSLPTLLYLVYFYFKGAVNEFLFAALFQNFGYLSSWSTGSHSGSSTDSGLFGRAAILAIFYLLSFVLYRKKLISEKISFLTLWFAATIFGALLSTRPYPHYLIQVLPPLILLLIFLFDSKLSKKIRLFTLFCILFLVFCFFRYKFYVYPVFSYYRNFYLQGNQMSYYGQYLERDYQISKFIKDNSSPDQPVFVWGDNPHLYALSERLPVGRYTVAYHITDFKQHSATMDYLRTAYPKFIVYFPQPGRPFPELDLFISRYYVPSIAYGEVVVFNKVDLDQ